MPKGPAHLPACSSLPLENGYQELGIASLGDLISNSWAEFARHKKGNRSLSGSALGTKSMKRKSESGRGEESSFVLLINSQF